MEWHGKGLDQGSLEHGKKICSSFKSNEVIKIKSDRKSRNKSEKFSKKRKFQNPGCYKPTPLRKISSSRFGCSGNHRKLTVLQKLAASRISFLPHNVPIVASNICAKGVYFTRFVALTDCSSLIPHILSC